MKYGIIGTGAIGGVLGGLLCQKGHDVCFVAKSNFGALQKTGLTLISNDQTIAVHPIVYNDISDMPKCDVLILLTKATANAELLPKLPNALNPGGSIIILQNGIGAEESLAGSVKSEQLFGGICYIKARQIQPGVMSYQGQEFVTIAPYATNDQSQLRLGEIAADFNAAGIKTTVTDSLVNVRWKKLVMSIPFITLSIKYNAKFHQILTEHYDELTELANEVAEGGRSCHIDIPQAWVENELNKWRTLFLRLPDSQPSMKDDYDARRPMEIEAIFFNVMKLAKQNGLSLPKTSAMYNEMHAFEVFSPHVKQMQSSVSTLHQLDDAAKKKLMGGILLKRTDMATNPFKKKAAIPNKDYKLSIINDCLALCETHHLALLPIFAPYKDYLEGKPPFVVCEFEREFLDELTSQLLLNRDGTSRKTMNYLSFIYATLKQIPDENEVCLQEKIRFFHRFFKLPIHMEDTSFYPPTILEQSAPPLPESNQVNDRAYIHLMGSGVEMELSHYILITINFLNWLKKTAPYKEKSAELSSLADKLSFAYLKFDYEFCIKTIDEHLYSSESILNGFPIVDVLRKKNIILTEPNIEKNYGRRFFEDVLSDGIIQSFLCKQAHNSSAHFDLIRDIVTSIVDMDMSNLEETIFAICNLSMTMTQMPWVDITEEEKLLCLQRLDKDWMWNTNANGSRDTTAFNLRQKASIMALGIPAFKQRGLLYKEGSLPKVESANTSTYGRLFYSRNTGPIVANQPMPYQKVSELDIVNPQIEVATYDKNPDYYPLKNSRAPYISSLSGHLIWVVVILDAYINKVCHKQSLEVTQRNISILFLLTAAIYTRQGYHSIFETLNVLTLKEIMAYFQKNGLELDPLLYLHADVLHQAINDAGNYALVLANKSIIHQCISSPMFFNPANDQRIQPKPARPSTIQPSPAGPSTD